MALTGVLEGKPSLAPFDWLRTCFDKLRVSGLNSRGALTARRSRSPYRLACGSASVFTTLVGSPATHALMFSTACV